MKHCHCARCNKPLSHPGVTLKVIMEDVDPLYHIKETLYFCWACAQTIDLEVHQYSASVKLKEKDKA